MGVKAAIFASAGKRTEHVIPGVYSRSTAIPNISGGVSAGNLCIMGKSNAGKPHAVLAFASLAEAQEVIDGALLKAVAYAFNPAPGYTPQRVFAMRVNPGTQSSLTLKKQQQAYLSLKPLLWGLGANTIALAIEDGTAAGTKKISTRYRNGVDSVDNVGHTPIELHYLPELAAQEKVYAQIDSHTLTLEKETAGVIIETPTFAVPLTGATLVEHIVDALTAAGYTATVGAAAGINAAFLEPRSSVALGGGPVPFLFAQGLTFVSSLPGASYQISDTALSIQDGTNPEVVLDFASYPTMGDLAAALNGISGFTATDRYPAMPAHLMAETGGEVSLPQDTVAEPAMRLAMTLTGQTADEYCQTLNGTTLALINRTIRDVTEPLVSVDFADHPLISDVVEVIQASPLFDARVVNEAEDADDPADLLDWFPRVELGNDWFGLTGNGYAVMEALKQLPLLDPESVALAAPYMRGFPDNTDFEPFENGTNGAYDGAAWNQALAILAQENIQLIATANTDPAVHALIKNHCETCSSVQQRKERKCRVGGPVGETVEQAIAAAKALNSSLATRHYPWVEAMNPLTGQRETIDGGYYACMMAGLESAVDVHIALTNKQMSVVRWGLKLTLTQMEKLIQAGVSIGGLDESEGLVNIRDVTTWQGNELQLCENCMVRADQYMNRDLRAAFQPVIGEPSGGRQDMVSAIATLKQKAAQWVGYGYIIPTDEGEYVWGITVQVDGDTTFITFNRYLTAPRNFVFITARNYLYSSAMTVGV